MKRIILILALLAYASAGVAVWSEWSKSGLETDDYKPIAIFVESVGPDAANISLTKERIQNHVELRLRLAGLTPELRTKDISKPTYLWININVVDPGFNVLVDYRRVVNYESGDRRYRKFATTWRLNSSGTHGNSAAFILEALDAHLDRFLNEYLKVNQK